MKYLYPILFLLCLASLGSAQERRMTPEQRRERVETVIIGKFAEELELTPAEAEKFYPRLRAFRASTEDLQRELATTRQELDALSVSDSAPEAKKRAARSPMPLSSLSESAPGASADNAAPVDVKALIARSNSLQMEILTKREALLTDLADFLSPQQVSRCSILLDELPRRIRQFMEERGGPPDAERRQHMEQRRRTR